MSFSLILAVQNNTILLWFLKFLCILKPQYPSWAAFYMRNIIIIIYILVIDHMPIFWSIMQLKYNLVHISPVCLGKKFTKNQSALKPESGKIKVAVISLLPLHYQALWAWKRYMYRGFVRILYNMYFKSA